MITSKWLVITVAAVLSAGGLTVLKSHAADRSLTQRPARRQFLERAKEKLGLTDDQCARIKSAVLGEKELLKILISKLHEARVELRTAIQAPDASETTVRSASAKLAAVEADLAVERLKLYSKINPVLTEEQRGKVKEFQSRIDDFVDSAIGRMGERLNSQ